MKYKFLSIFIIYFGTNNLFATGQLKLKTNTGNDLKLSEKKRLVKLRKSEAEKTADRILKMFGINNNKDSSHQKQIQNLIEKEHEQIKKLFGNDYQNFFNNLSQRGNASSDNSDLKKIEKDMMKSMQMFFDKVPNMNGVSKDKLNSSLFKYEWRSGNKLKKKILVLKLKLKKDQALDIKIRGRSVNVRGTLLEATNSKTAFKINKSILILDGLDESRAEFSNVEEDIHISFPIKISK